MEKWSLISCQVFSKLIRHYRERLRSVILEKEVAKRVPIIMASVFWSKTFISYNVIYPHFQFFYFNEGLDFCDFFFFFEWKIKRINNADLFFTASFDHIYQGCHQF